MMYEPQRIDQLIVTIEGIEYSFHEDLDGGIVATVVKYPSCQAYGANLEEALEAVQDALCAILEDLQGMGSEIPADLQPFLEAQQGRGR
ncbi:MAG: type II toxin-antitoxin system HicB family antitoxin [Chloroflexi bacterium]|nr:type II toxin-antitoxin system HicB family antitoxin [Chloroflexota bacterium]